MDSLLHHDRPVYNSIPVPPASAPRRASLRDTVFHHVNRVSRSSPISRLFNALSVLTLIAVAVFLLSSPCISCDLLTLKHRVLAYTPHRQSAVQQYIPTNAPYYQSKQAALLDSHSHYQPSTLSRFSSPKTTYWSRQDRASEQGDFVIEEWVSTRSGCAEGIICRARLVVTKKGYDVIIQAGYHISGVGGVHHPIDSVTKAKVLAVITNQALYWAYLLLNRVHELLLEVNCIAHMVDVAKAIYESSRIAATCPSTDDPRCYNLITVEKCTHLPPTPVPLDSCEVAFDECEFTFQGQTGLATFSIDGPADKSFTPVIVAKDPDVNLGVLNSNNVVPEFIEDSGAFPITDFGSQSFAPTQFKPYYIWQEQGSGIGHQTFYADQEELARGRCIRIYFTEIQLVDPYSNLNHVPISENKCVVFRTE